jgi:hypothetical protein
MTLRDCFKCGNPHCAPESHTCWGLTHYNVWCPDCDTRTEDFDTAEQAAEAWNNGDVYVYDVS